MVEPDNRLAQCRLAAAGLADEAEGLPLLLREGDAVHRLDRRMAPKAADGEMLLEVIDNEDRIRVDRLYRCIQNFLCQEGLLRRVASNERGALLVTPHACSMGCQHAARW